MRDGQERIDHRGQPGDFFKHASDDVLVFDIAMVMLQANFANASHRGEWSSQLVGHIGCKALQFLESFLKSSQETIQNARHATEFIVGIFDRNATAQPGRGDLLG